MVTGKEGEVVEVRFTNELTRPETLNHHKSLGPKERIDIGDEVKFQSNTRVSRTIDGTVTQRTK